MTDCPLFCSYDCCLNRGGGTVYDGQGVTRETEPAAARVLSVALIEDRLAKRAYKLKKRGAEPLGG